MGRGRGGSGAGRGGWGGGRVDGEEVGGRDGRMGGGGRRRRQEEEEGRGERTRRYEEGRLWRRRGYLPQQATPLRRRALCALWRADDHDALAELGEQLPRAHAGVTWGHLVSRGSHGVTLGFAWGHKSHGSHGVASVT
eukprot:4788568-Prymnesium_polylepis.2